MQSFDSESIEAGGYEARTRTLRLRFAGGHTYDYRNVPITVYNDLLSAPSKGRFVNWHVKPHYRYRRVR
ncbi:KTSC domain-containing protein [Dongia soli]|uniref:KTSC domain-containing protein n=1 Tax=Dongia soli TaxID=600628 RepID=A0ABU5E7H4_9PROT|nr:KTSC domain-containing protein [Dongia soli]MDY0881974.1 KTSC domain-containing protein [Dongia soli]